MQLRVVRSEMVTEPPIQIADQLRLVQNAVILYVVHDVTQVIKQRFVIFLVFRVCRIPHFAHHLLFERKMRRDLCINLAQRLKDLISVDASLYRLMQFVDQSDEFTVFVIDLFNTDLEFIFPLQKAHRILKPPFSALNVIVR